MMTRCAVFLLLVGLLSGTAAAELPFPAALTAFESYPGNPVFTGAGPGHWDERIRERGWILKEGNTWRMWYTGYRAEPGAMMKLGLATSADGLTWTRHPENPIFDEVWVEDMQVIRDGDRYVMVAEGLHDQAQLLTSADGVAWERVGPLDVRLTTGQPIPPGPYGTPSAFREADIWHLFYERRDAGVWHATSPDLRVWTNVSDDPVLVPGPTAYDARLIAVNQILKHDGRYYALYHGTDDATLPALWTSNLAVSDDLRTWTKSPANPLFPPEANRSSNLLVPLGPDPEAPTRYRLYTMHAKVEAFLPTRGTPVRPAAP